MTSKKARLRKPQSGTHITVTKNTLSRAQRKAATAKKTALANLEAAAAKKAAPAVAAAPKGVPVGRKAAPPKKGPKK